MKNQKLGGRITMILFLLMSLMAVILTVVMYASFRKVFLRFYNEKAQDIVHFLAEYTNWDALRPYMETGEKDEYAETLMKYYNGVKTSFRGVAYLYMLIPEDDHFTYVIEGQTPDDDPDDINTLGDVFYYTEAEYEHLVPDAQAAKPSTDIIFSSNDIYGDYINAWAPVFDSTGTFRAMVEADISVNQIRTDLNSTLVQIILLFMFCVLGALLFMLFYLRRNVIFPIGRLTESVDSYEHGDLRLQLNKYRHEDEIKHLALSFRDMTRRIEEYTREVEHATAEKQRIGAELSVATQIQENMLPNVFPAFPGRKEFDLYAAVTPAKEVGGDFYDFFLIDDDHLALVIADISDKGIPAGLLMVVTKTIFKNQTLMGKSPAEVMREVNRQLYENNGGDMFVKAWFGILELSTGTLRSANAGHRAPAYRPAGGSFETLRDKKGIVLALVADARYEETKLVMKPGSGLFLYTDGLLEAVNAQDEFFGVNRILETLNENTSARPTQIVRAVKKRVTGFVKDTPQPNDITMLSVTFSGADGAENGKRSVNPVKTSAL